MKLRLLGARVLVIQDSAPTQTQSGIQLSPRHSHPSSIGTVTHVGTGYVPLKYSMPTLKPVSGEKEIKSKTQAIPLIPGDRIHFKPYTGSEFEFAGVKYRMLDPNDVLALLEENVVAETI